MIEELQLGVEEDREQWLPWNEPSTKFRNLVQDNFIDLDVELNLMKERIMGLRVCIRQERFELVKYKAYQAKLNKGFATLRKEENSRNRLNLEGSSNLFRGARVEI